MDEFGRVLGKQNSGSAQDVRVRRRLARKRNTEINESPKRLSACRRRAPVSLEYPPKRRKINIGVRKPSHLLFFARMFCTVTDETDHGVPTQWLAVPAHPPEEPAVGSGHDSSPNLRNLSDGQFEPVDPDGAHLNLDPALHGEPVNPVQCVLRPGTPCDVLGIVHTMDD